ncbi:MAG: hypothetical protein KatS3mg105_3947 [Gemmatales bacterium]|nr:MAG: hypothetical protein KatS3mg105_3947 [Gemmatales bacterium]
MGNGKAGPIAGIIAGIFAVVAVSISLYRPGAVTLEERAAVLLDKPVTDASDAAEQIKEIETFSAADDFAQLPDETREQMRKRLEALQAYLQFERELDRITPPQQIRGIDQLARVRKRLQELHPPREFAASWEDSQGVRRRRLWLEELSTLKETIEKTQQQYEALCADADRVLKNSQAADLPGRAKKVLDKARSVPNPDEHATRHLPRSNNLTYATVFAFRDVRDAYDLWQKKQKKLQAIVDKFGKTP